MKQIVEPAIMQSAFQFKNGKRMICYSSYENGIRSFECAANWQPFSKPFAECPFEWCGQTTMTEYHLKIRAQHKPEDFVPEHSTDLTQSSPQVSLDNKHWYDLKDLMKSAMNKNVSPEDWVGLCKALGYNVSRKVSLDEAAQVGGLPKLTEPLISQEDLEAWEKGEAAQVKEEVLREQVKHFMNLAATYQGQKRELQATIASHKEEIERLTEKKEWVEALRLDRNNYMDAFEKAQATIKEQKEEIENSNKAVDALYSQIGKMEADLRNQTGAQTVYVPVSVEDEWREIFGQYTSLAHYNLDDVKEFLIPVINWLKRNYSPPKPLGEVTTPPATSNDELLEAAEKYANVMETFTERLPDNVIVDMITAAVVADAHKKLRAAIQAAKEITNK